MKRLRGCVLAVVMAWMTVFHSVDGKAQSRDVSHPKVVLLSPTDDTQLGGNTMRFVWRLRTAKNDIRIAYFELTVSAKRMHVSISKKVMSMDTAHTVDYVWTEMKKDMPRHGRYFWFVEAVDSAGNRFRSDVRSFVITAFPIEEHIATDASPYTVRLGYNHRVKTSDYRKLINNADPRTHLLSYSEVGFSFRQDRMVWPRLQMQETVRVLSLAGLGVEVSPKYCLMENDYVSMSPYLLAAIGWYATGLKSYSSKMANGSVGCEWKVLPGGYLTVSLEWILLSQIRYLEIGNGLRTFDGKGWEGGVRLMVPRPIMNHFKLFGIEIDPSRIPIEFRFGQVHDAYTGLDMQIRKIGIGYFVQ